ncbi:MAG: lipopolysaccharide transport periplasmic protein LptA [Methylococcales bacterium]|nr:lipopolysaccharide transport periplasmic protein LptA [Methylococcales bacterium]
MIRNKPHLLLLSVPILFYSTLSTGLENDNEQPIYIDSDTASYDEKNDVSVYTGDVIFTQGSLVVNSDEMTFYLTDGAIDKVVAVGKPARFKQSPGKGKGDIHGLGLIGEYYPGTQKLHLINKAQVWQDGKRTASDIIVYDTKASVLMAGDRNSKSKRVRTTIQPKSKAKKK